MSNEKPPVPKQIKVTLTICATNEQGSDIVNRLTDIMRPFMHEIKPLVKHIHALEITGEDMDDMALLDMLMPELESIIKDNAKNAKNN